MEFTKKGMRVIMNGKHIAVWGAGHIGMTTLISLVNAGYKGIAVDVNKQVLNKLQNNSELIEMLKQYYNGHINIDVENINIDSYTPEEFLNIEDNVMIHFVSVPTELNGMPLMDIVEKTIALICDYEKKHNQDVVTVVIESTLTPGTAKKLYNMLLEAVKNKRIRFIVAPRRDWFEKEYNIKDIIRIYGAESKASADFIEPILKNTTPSLRRASHYTIAEMVKPVENSFRYLDVMYVQQLALSYSDIDIREVLELAGTKWNMNTYYPSIGIGGYCIPVSGHYILEGIKNEDYLTLLHEVIDFQKEFTELFCNFIFEAGLKKIGILGGTYRDNVLILKGSHITDIIKRLREMNIQTYLADPVFDAAEIETFFHVKEFEIKNVGKYGFDGIIVNNWHKEYDTIIDENICKQMFSSKMLLDSTGKLEAFAQKNGLLNYRLIGRSQWNKEAL